MSNNSLLITDTQGYLIPETRRNTIWSTYDQPLAGPATPPITSPTPTSPTIAARYEYIFDGFNESSDIDDIDLNSSLPPTPTPTSKTTSAPTTLTTTPTTQNHEPKTTATMLSEPEFALTTATATTITTTPTRRPSHDKSKKVLIWLVICGLVLSVILCVTVVVVIIVMDQNSKKVTVDDFVDLQGKVSHLFLLMHNISSQ